MGYVTENVFDDCGPVAALLEEKFMLAVREPNCAPAPPVVENSATEPEDHAVVPCTSKNVGAAM